MSRSWRVPTAIFALLSAGALSACQPPDKEVLVKSRSGTLIVDFPWSVWRLVGLQDRTWSIREIVVYDRQEVIWRAVSNEEDWVREVRMPIVLGAARAGFKVKGSAQFRRNHRYGVAVDGIGNGRVDFEIGDDGEVRNFVGRNELIQPPCGKTSFSYAC